MRGVCDDVTCLFLHSGVVQVLKVGQVHPKDPFCCPSSALQPSCIYIYIYIYTYTYTVYSSQHLKWIKKVNQSCPTTRMGIVLVLGQLL